MAKVAWILGAGFSAPLGGPLLKGLLTPSAWHQVKHEYGTRFPSVFRLEGAWASTLYQYGRKFELGDLFPSISGGEQLWGDAETFIDELDAEAVRLATIPNIAPQDFGHLERAASILEASVVDLAGMTRAPSWARP